MQVLLPRGTAWPDLGAILRRLGRAARKELVDERVHLADFGIAEVPREERREVVNHAPALHFADRVRRRADEHPAVLVLAVLLVVAHLDRGGLFRIRREGCE